MVSYPLNNKTRFNTEQYNSFALDYKYYIKQDKSTRLICIVMCFLSQQSDTHNQQQNKKTINTHHIQINNRYGSASFCNILNNIITQGKLQTYTVNTLYIHNTASLTMLTDFYSKFLKKILNIEIILNKTVILINEILNIYGLYHPFFLNQQHSNLKNSIKQQNTKILHELKNEIENIKSITKYKKTYKTINTYYKYGILHLYKKIKYSKLINEETINKHIEQLIILTSKLHKFQTKSQTKKHKYLKQLLHEIIEKHPINYKIHHDMLFKIHKFLDTNIYKDNHDNAEDLINKKIIHIKNFKRWNSIHSLRVKKQRNTRIIYHKNKIYGSFYYRNREFKIVDTSISAHKDIIKICNSLQIKINVSEHKQCVNTEESTLINKLIRECETTAIAIFKIGTQMNTTIKNQLSIIFKRCVEQLNLNCVCSIYGTNNSEKITNPEKIDIESLYFPTTYCDACLEKRIRSINNKTFFTTCSISEFMVGLLKTTFQLIEDRDKDNIPTALLIQSIDRKRYYITYRHYFKHYNTKQLVTGPINLHYVVGQYQYDNITEIDINSAYTNILTNIFQYLYDFQSRNIITSAQKIKPILKNLQANNNYYLVQVKFKYKDNTLYNSIPVATYNKEQNYFLQSGISKYISNYEYERLLQDTTIEYIKPVKLIYYLQYKKTTPFNLLIKTIVSLKNNSTNLIEKQIYKLIGNGLYGKLLQTADKTKHHLSLNTALYETKQSSSICNTYLASLTIAGCRAIIAETQYQAYLQNIKIASAITDGIIILENNVDKVKTFINTLETNKIITSIIHPTTQRIFKSQYHTQCTYIGIKKRTEAILTQNTVIKQTIGPFVHKDNINLLDVYKKFCGGSRIISKRVQHHRIINKIKHLPSSKIFITNIKPNLDPNRDREIVVTDKQNMSIHTKAHKHYYNAILYNYYYNKMLNKKTHGIFNNKHLIQDRINDIKYKQEYDHIKLWGIVDKTCILTRLLYIAIADKKNIQHKKPHINYHITYQIAKKLQILKRRGKKQKLSDSYVSERINKLFLHEMHKREYKLNNIAIKQTIYTEIQNYAYKHYTKKRSCIFLNSIFKYITKKINIIRNNNIFDYACTDNHLLQLSQKYKLILPCTYIKKIKRAIITQQQHGPPPINEETFCLYTMCAF